MAAILLVDDDDLVRETVAVSLAERGHTVLQASHGLQALQVLRAAPVDAVILDIMMPEMEGIETLREIRRGWPRMPVVVISGGDRSGWTSALEMAAKLGADRTLAKPFTPSQLIELLEVMMRDATPT